MVYGGSILDTMAQGRVALNCECTCVVSSVTWVPTRWLAPYARGLSLQGSTPYLPRPLPRNSLQLLNNHKTLFPSQKQRDTTRTALFFKAKTRLGGFVFHIDVHCKDVECTRVFGGCCERATGDPSGGRGEAGAGTGAEFVQVVFVWCGGRRGREKKKGDEGAAGLRTAM